jgi:hypothetical protein
MRGAPRRRLAQRGVDDAHRVADRAGVDQRGHVAQRHVRGDARRPQAAGDVELAHEVAHAQAVLQPAQFVLLRKPAQAQRMLVERREHDRVGRALLHGLAGQLERLHRAAAGCLGGLAQRRLDAAQRVVAPPADLAGGQRRVGPLQRHQRQRHAGLALAGGQHHGVGDQQHGGRRARRRVGQQAHRHLRAHSAGITRQHGHTHGPRQAHCPSTLMLASRTSLP